jgi:prepilin-type N-terminal cleavage/methylation domain-containing protein
MSVSVKSERGDTLIEVLVAIAVLGALITVAYAVMNRGFASTQNSLDRTTTQAMINGQASMLRAAHARAANGDPTAWNAIVALVPPKQVASVNTYVTPPSDPTANGQPVIDGCASSFSSYDQWNFYFDVNRTDGVDPMVPKKVDYGATPSLPRKGTTPKLGDGLWIEGHGYQPGVNEDLYVFYIKSCWAPTYSSGNNVTSQVKTVVRLYAPN